MIGDTGDMVHDLGPPLAVVLDPQPGEALPSYLARVADANCCTRTDLGWSAGDDVLRHAQTVDLDLVARRTGVPQSVLAELTMLDHGPAVTGRTLPYTRRTGWRVPGQRRRCPDCPPGHRLAVWDLALHLTCPDHHRLLLPTRWDSPLPRPPDGDPLIDHGAHVDAVLADLRPATPAADIDAEARTRASAARARLRLTHRLARLLALTADTTWPVTASAYLERLRGNHPWQTADAAWTTSGTPSNPIALAVLVSASWQAARSSRDTQALVAEAWRRIDAVGLELSRKTVRTLPPRPRPPRQRTRMPRSVTLRTAQWQLFRQGLHPRHVPFLLHDIPTHGVLPPVHAIPEAHALARLLLHLIDPSDTADLPATSVLRIGPSLGSDPLRDLRLTGTLPAATLALLDGRADRLASEAVDYQQRRHALGGLHRIPASVISPAAEAPRESTGTAGIDELAAGWIWVHLTGGPLVRHRHQFRNADLAGFDRSLDPEQRLCLHDHGHHLLTETGDLIDRSHPTPASGRRAADPQGEAAG